MSDADYEKERDDEEGALRSDEAAELTPEEQQEALEEQLRAEKRRYFNVSRSLAAGFLFVLPLLAVYELGVLTDISAAAAWAKTPISWLRRHPVEILGADTTVILNAVFIAAMALAAWRLGRLGALRGRTFLGMLLESGLYAVLIVPIALFPLVGRWEFGPFAANFSDFWPKIVASCGAGVYEELLFRLLLMGVLVFLAKELGGLKPFAAGLLALFVSGVLFSAAHFLSPAESPNYTAFLFRLIAGMVFGVIYLTRGFGIAAWTHALYDIYVLCFLVE